MSFLPFFLLLKTAQLLSRFRLTSENIAFSIQKKIVLAQKQHRIWLNSLSIRRFRGKGERWKRKRERAEQEKRLTQMLLLEHSTPTQQDSIPSNQNHFQSLGCQLQVSKSSPKINLTLRSGRAPALVLLRFRFFLKPPIRRFRMLVMENLPFLKNYNRFLGIVLV